MGQVAVTTECSSCLTGFRRIQTLIMLWQCLVSDGVKFHYQLKCREQWHCQQLAINSAGCDMEKLCPNRSGVLRPPLRQWIQC